MTVLPARPAEPRSASASRRGTGARPACLTCLTYRERRKRARASDGAPRKEVWVSKDGQGDQIGRARTGRGLAAVLPPVPVPPLTDRRRAERGPAPRVVHEDRRTARRRKAKPEEAV
jgi:hypothetical protein